MSVYEKDNKYYISNYVDVIYHTNREKINACPAHLHDFVEMVYISKGKCVHTVDGVEYPLRHGDLLVINYNQTHSFDDIKGTDFINILIKPEFVNRSIENEENVFALLNLSEFEDFRKILDSKKNVVTFSGEERDRIEDIISIIRKEAEEKKPGYDLAVRSNLNVLLLMVFRKMSISFETIYGGMSEAVLKYIRERCGEKITLKEMAKRCLYNTSYFSRVFKEYTGMTFTAYLKNMRMEKAAELIKNTDMRIEDIICDVGYSDRTRFFSDFRAHMGESPLKYRKSKK